MEKWQVSKIWQRKHTSSQLRYTVTLRVFPATVMPQLWTALQAEGEQGAHTDELSFGGVVLRHDGNDTVTAVSGGEDGLDSLDYGINDVLLSNLKAVAPQASWFQVKELRERA